MSTLVNRNYNQIKSFITSGDIYYDHEDDTVRNERIIVAHKNSLIRLISRIPLDGSEVVDYDANLSAGAGSGGDTNHLSKESIAEKKPLFYSVFGFKAFIGTSEENVGILKNNDSVKNLYIDVITFSHNGETTDGRFQFKPFFDSTYNSGGSQKTPINLNRGSSETSSAQFWIDPTDVTDGTSYEAFFMRQENVKNIPYRGSLVLPPGKTWHVKAKGYSGKGVYLSIRWWEL